MRRVYRSRRSRGRMSPLLMGSGVLPEVVPGTPPTAPVIDLLAISDRGASTTDNITNDPLPQFSIDLPDDTEAGDVVRLKVNGSTVATHELTSGDLSGGEFFMGAAPLADGTYDFTTTLENAGGESVASNTVNYTLNTSLGACTVTLNAGGTETGDTTPDIRVAAAGAVANDIAEVRAADGTVLGTATWDAADEINGYAVVTVSALAEAAHTVTGYVYGTAGGSGAGTFTATDDFAFTVSVNSMAPAAFLHYARQKELPMQYLKQSTASQSVLIGPLVDSTDAVTPETGLTIANTDIRLSKNGGNMAAKASGGGTHDELGMYTITLDATDTDTVGKLQLVCAMAGALPVYHTFYVLEENVYDAWFAASAAAGTDLASILTDTGTTLDTAISAIKTVTDRQVNIMGTGTCTTGGSTTAVICSATTPTSIEDDQFNGRIIVFRNDTTTTALRGQATDITDYTHATLTFTVTALSEAPASGDVFDII